MVIHMIHNGAYEDEPRVTIKKEQHILQHRFSEDIVVPMKDVPAQMALRNVQYSAYPIMLSYEYKVPLHLLHLT